MPSQTISIASYCWDGQFSAFFEQLAIHYIWSGFPCLESLWRVVPDLSLWGCRRYYYHNLIGRQSNFEFRSFVFQLTLCQSLRDQLSTLKRYSFYSWFRIVWIWVSQSFVQEIASFWERERRSGGHDCTTRRMELDNNSSYAYQNSFHLWDLVPLIGNFRRIEKVSGHHAL